MLNGELLERIETARERLMRQHLIISESEERTPLMMGNTVTFDAPTGLELSEILREISRIHVILLKKSADDSLASHLVREMNDTLANFSLVSPMGVMPRYVLHLFPVLARHLSIAKAWLYPRDLDTEIAKRLDLAMNRFDDFLVMLLCALDVDDALDASLRIFHDMPAPQFHEFELDRLYCSVVEAAYHVFFNSRRIDTCNFLGLALHHLDDWKISHYDNADVPFVALLTGRARIALAVIQQAFGLAISEPSDLPQNILFLKHGCAMCAFFQNSIAYRALEVLSMTRGVDIHVSHDEGLAYMLLVDEFPALVLPNEAIWCGIIPDDENESDTRALAWRLVSRIENAFGHVGAYRMHLSRLRQNVRDDASREHACGREELTR